MIYTLKKHIDEEIVHEIVSGDQGAFKKLFQKYYKRLCQFAFLFVRSKELSEEVVSDVFFNVWMKREQLHPERNIRSFLYTSVRNQAINYCLRENPIHSMDNIDVYKLEIATMYPPFDDMIDNKLFSERLQQSFNTLPERCRMIARMHFNDQLQSSEIAEILQISNSTVKTQITIAIQKIKDIFDKYGWNK